jgi:integrase
MKLKVLKISYTVRNHSNRYQVIFYDEFGEIKREGKQGFALTNIGMRECREVARLHIERLEKQYSKLEKSNNNEVQTFKELTKKYFATRLKDKELNTTHLYTAAFNRFSSLDDKLISKLKLIDFQDVIDNMNIQPASIRNYVVKIKTLMNTANDLYDCGFAANLNKLEIPKVIINYDKKKILNNDEVFSLLDSIKDKDNNFIIFFALNTGLRIGEILGLTWQDIDFENKRIYVNKQWKLNEKHKYDYGDLKTKYSRFVNLTVELKEKLIDYKKGMLIDNERIFSIFKNTHNTDETLNKILKPYGITLHKLRHTFGSLLVNSGIIPLKQISEMMGHSIEMLLKTYSHTSKESEKIAADNIDAIVTRRKSGKKTEKKLL